MAATVSRVNIFSHRIIRKRTIDDGSAKEKVKLC
jgi:hypothetical protein